MARQIFKIEEGPERDKYLEVLVADMERFVEMAHLDSRGKVNPIKLKELNQRFGYRAIKGSANLIDLLQCAAGIDMYFHPSQKSMRFLPTSITKDINPALRAKAFGDLDKAEFFEGYWEYIGLVEDDSEMLALIEWVDLFPKRPSEKDAVEFLAEHKSFVEL